MECVEGALKSSLMGVKTNPHHRPQPFSDDLCVAGDDFFVDGLLDFSKDGGFVEDNDNTQVIPTQEDVKNDNNYSVSPLLTDNNINFPVPETHLSLSADDVADLEWVSQFVDDSFSDDYSLTCPPHKFPEKKMEPEPEPVPEPENLVIVRPNFTTPVQTKARSKRTRTGGRFWSLGSSPLTDSSTSCSSSSSCTSNPWFIFHDPSQTAESIFGKPPVKRQRKRKPAATTETAGSGQQQSRRCSHCLVQKTPQWRAGPLGAKTLCNACGVRYKSGRLLPEYRPACSPTFSSDLHSNNHRKVLEMRQKKETVDTGLTQPVQNF